MSDDDLLFVDKNGKPIHSERVSKMFDASLRRYNGNRPKDERLPPIRLHDLRHSHASHLIDAGVNVKVISERLGHGSIQVTLAPSSAPERRVSALGEVKAQALHDCNQEQAHLAKS
jgi:integrase